MSCCEYKVKKYLHERKKRPQSDFFTEEIEQATDVYAEFVISIIEGMKRNGVEPLCFVEERLDFSNIVPEGFGTGDMIILGKVNRGGACSTSVTTRMEKAFLWTPTKTAQ